MKLTWFEISNFHSVVNSGKINIEELIVLVGKNQAGKSSILQGLEYLSFTTSTKASSEVTTINGINSDYEDESINSRDLPIVKANFHLEQNELEEITKNLSKTYSDKMDSEDPFEKFIISLMEQSVIEFQKESTVESNEDLENKDTKNDTDDPIIKKIEYTIEKTLDELKFSKLITNNFEDIVIQKFVDGEYSIIINDEEYFFKNPTILRSEFVNIGKKYGEKTMLILRELQMINL